MALENQKQQRQHIIQHNYIALNLIKYIRRFLASEIFRENKLLQIDRKNQNIKNTFVLILVGFVRPCNIWKSISAPPTYAPHFAAATSNEPDPTNGS